MNRVYSHINSNKFAILSKLYIILLIYKNIGQNVPYKKLKRPREKSKPPTPVKHDY
jgi:hypothetical protein